MRAGQLCVVHGVGGLVDTVEDDVTGFVFDGATPGTQAANFASAVDCALQMKISRKLVEKIVENGDAETTPPPW